MSPAANEPRTSLLLVRTSQAVIGLPLGSVLETLRPLPCAPVEGAPPELLGLSVIRGAPVPVVDLARALGHAPGPAARLVTLRTGVRSLALRVDGVVGTTSLPTRELNALPPLLGEESGLARLGRLDRELLLVLEPARLLPPALVA